MVSERVREFFCCVADRITSIHFNERNTSVHVAVLWPLLNLNKLVSLTLVRQPNLKGLAFPRLKYLSLVAREDALEHFAVSTGSLETIEVSSMTPEMLRHSMAPLQALRKLADANKPSLKSIHLGREIMGQIMTTIVFPMPPGPVRTIPMIVQELEQHLPPWHLLVEKNGFNTLCYIFFGTYFSCERSCELFNAIFANRSPLEKLHLIGDTYASAKSSIFGGISSLNSIADKIIDDLPSSDRTMNANYISYWRTRSKHRGPLL